MKLSSLCRRWGFVCPPHGGRLCHNAEWSLRDASQASWQSRVFGYLGDCFSRCCSFAMTLRHSLRGLGEVVSSSRARSVTLLIRIVLAAIPAISTYAGGGQIGDTHLYI